MCLLLRIMPSSPKVFIPLWIKRPLSSERRGHFLTSNAHQKGPKPELGAKQKNCDAISSSVRGANPEEKTGIG